MHRQIRIQSDGIGSDTVVTTESGEQVYPIEANIFLEARERNKIELTFIDLKADVHADLEETVLCCPICHHEQSHHCPPETL